jgi:hypothetical protein
LKLKGQTEKSGLFFIWRPAESGGAISSNQSGSFQSQAISLKRKHTLRPSKKGGVQRGFSIFTLEWWVYSGRKSETRQIVSMEAVTA